MLCGLKNKDDWSIVDCLRTSKGEGKFSPPTFADIEVDEHGVEHPCDPNLHDETDSMTRQALDYIFWLKPHEAQEQN